MKGYDIDDLFEGITKGDRTKLSRSITLIESIHPGHQVLASELLNRCLQIPTSSRRIGISGSPGVGKSTFIEALGLHMTTQGEKLAVLAIDPSSQLTGGSILGDKTRMEYLSRQPDVFIRPSPAGDTLGGVARKTRETTLLCEAAGFDNIIIETVGVGQSEYTVRHLVDCFLLLLLPGAGDDLQGIKKGIMEMADIVVINKADGDQVQTAKKTAGYYASALHLLKGRSDSWNIPVQYCSALSGENIPDIYEVICTYFNSQFESIKANRAIQNRYWFETTVENLLKEMFFNEYDMKPFYKELKLHVESGRLTAFDAARQIMSAFEAKINS
jgi:LAO/AO transport system kinase